MPMLIDQEGLPPGVPGVARRDGLSDGSLVTLTDTRSGGTTLFELLWVPLADVNAIPSLQPYPDNDHAWGFLPTEGVTGPYRIKLTHIENGLKTEEIRIFGIPDSDGRVPPAPGERTDPRVTRLNAIDPSIVARCERNWPIPGFPQGNPFGWAIDAFIPTSTPDSEGEPGAPGSVWRFGNDAPEDNVGINGDFYLRTSNGEVWYRASGAYTAIGQFAVPGEEPALLRSAQDFQSFTHKPVPARTDALLFENNSSFGAKAQSTLGELFDALAPPRIPATLGSLYVVPPATPHEFDDEFLDGSPDLAERGWTICDWVTGVPLTRIGDVRGRSTVANPAPGFYRSTLTPAGLVIMTGSAQAVWIGKPVNPTLAGLTFLANVSPADVAGAQYYCFAVLANTIPNPNMYIGTAWEGLNKGDCRFDNGAFVRTNWIADVPKSSATPWPISVICWYPGTGNITATFHVSPHGIILSGANYANPANGAFVPAHAGLIMQCDGAAGGRHWWCIRSLRRYAEPGPGLTAWPGLP